MDEEELVDSQQCRHLNLQDSVPAALTLILPNKGNEQEIGNEKLPQEQCHGQEVLTNGADEGVGVCSGTANSVVVAHTSSSPPESTFLQGPPEEDDEGCEMSESLTPPRLATSSQPSASESPSTVRKSPQPRHSSPDEVVDGDFVIDEPLYSYDGHPLSNSHEERLTQESIGRHRNGAAVESDSTDTMRSSCNSPSRKHSRGALKHVLATNTDVDQADILAFSPVHSLSPPCASIASSPPHSAQATLHRITSSHYSPCPLDPDPFQPAIHKHDIILTENRPQCREQLANSPSRRLRLSSPHRPPVAVKSLKFAPIFSEIKKTIDNANKFGRAMAALAESGSSDQDSDSEPHHKHLDLHPHESAKVTEKMRVPHSSMRQRVVIRKNPDEVSFGFSIADGQYDLGVYVKTIKAGGPSERGGLLQYDKLIKVGTSTTSRCAVGTCVLIHLYLIGSAII